jgi:DnaK suppressor protein
MDQQRAEELLRDEHSRLNELLRHSRSVGIVEREGAIEQGDIADSAEPFTSEEVNDAIEASLRARLEAVERAQVRLREGTYGRSLRSGAIIPDDRLEADPAAELTVEELEAG